MNHLAQRLLLLLLLVTSAGSGFAQGGGQPDSPIPFGPNNAGKEFWLSFPSNWDLPNSTSYYIRLYISSAVATEVRVSAAGVLKETIQTTPYTISTVDLSPAEAQAVVRRDVDPVPNDQIYRNKAIHIEADAPVVVYGMNLTSFTSDGLLAIPVNGLGREYVVASYPAVIGTTQELPSQFVVVGAYDSTTVTIYQPMTSPNHAAGDSLTITLDQGDVYSGMSIGYGGDMSGATIRANKPVSVLAGQACAYIPNQIIYCCCDHIVEMMLPTDTWGTVYHGVPITGRTKGDFYRIYASENNTAVSVNGTLYATLSRRGGTQGTGWVEYIAPDKGLIEISADKPIAVTQYNTSQTYDNVPSDPFQMTLLPLEQHQMQVVFSTPGADFVQNYINIVCDSAAFHEIEFAVAGDTNSWDRLDQMPGVSSARSFSSPVNGRTYVGATLPIEPGAYRLRGPRGFAGYLYGFNAYHSYGYPLSASTEVLSSTDTTSPAIAIMNRDDCAGRVFGVTDDLAGEAFPSNLSSVDLLPGSSSNYRLVTGDFVVGARGGSATFSLQVIDRAQPATAILVVADRAGNIGLDTVYYQGASYSASSSSVHFNDVDSGVGSTLSVALTNLTDQPITFSRFVLARGNVVSIISPTGAVTAGPAGSSTAEVVVELNVPADARTGLFLDSLLVTEDGCERMAAVVDGRVVGKASGVEIANEVPARIAASLSPNPVNGDQVSLQLRVDQRSDVTIALVEPSGKRLRTLFHRHTMERGDHPLLLDVAGVGSGSYFITITADAGSLTLPLTIVH